MPVYRYQGGANSDSCVINGIDLKKNGFDVNLESEIEDDKNVSVTQTAGTKVIYEFANAYQPKEFTLSFRYGQEIYNLLGFTYTQQPKFTKQIATLNAIYSLNEPLKITFEPLKAHGIDKIVMLNRRIRHYELFDSVEISCVEYKEDYVQLQSEMSAENWYVNALDNSDLQSVIDAYIDALSG